MYKAIEYFTDLQDNGYAYNVGDTYPREGYEPTAERIEELSSGQNVRGRAVIALYVETVEEPTEVAEEPVEDEKPKKRKRS